MVEGYFSLDLSICRNGGVALFILFIYLFNFIRMRVMEDGRWRVVGYKPPILLHSADYHFHRKR